MGWKQSAEIRSREDTRKEYNAHALCKPQIQSRDLDFRNFPENLLATVHARM